ncbi:hypothetical protein V6N13_045979 [Hibiscus sabdariffa]|uniref:Uncharacterized protein n=2 Tax=Hibiscus sabdariffa TaxID=183260 RepID=A0ABR2ASE3_9ROSI
MVSENLFRTSLVISLLVVSLQLGATRPLHGEQRLTKDELLFQSLQRGPVTGSGHNPCTEIPGRETDVCKLGGMNVAGYVMQAAPAFPGVVAELGEASIAEGTSS